ncbi:MAG TPA: DUF692 domain-containing protein [Stellaceae bacterium]|nr:DUF692 domain-containing protein [Stellaceae bacterium]
MAAAAEAATTGGSDRFGFGWRRELAAGILANLDRIDLIEIIAEDHFRASRAALRTLRRLAAQIPVVWHGVSLGLASTVPVDPRRLDQMARLVGETGAESWSEHLAFVRGGGVEIGHLAAPPRSAAAIDGACANIERARRIVGASPLVENVATLVAPPASTLDEPQWVRGVIEGSGAGLLLDLHNLYANARNFGEEPHDFLARFPLHRVAAVHLAGGRWIAGPNGKTHLLDDHLHDVPDAVFALLTDLGRLAPQPLNVIVERDGRYPPVAALLDQLDRARRALAAGRALAARNAEAA